MHERSIVFAGDSITAAGRTEAPTALGSGYVALLAHSPQLNGWTVLNRGRNGDRTKELVARWTTDVVDEQPTILSLLVGVNDTWRRFDSGDPTTLDDFEDRYRQLLTATPARELVLIEPFLLPINDAQREWLDDLEAKQEIVRALAREFGAVLVDAARMFADTGNRLELAPDGVHPSDEGHRLLAELWLERAGHLLS